MEIHVRKSSSYFESLTRLNQSELADEPIKIVEADETLEDEELLEMVNADLIPAIVMDSHKLDFWRRVYPDIKVQDDVPVREGGEIAWAMRKNSPQLMELVNSYVDVAAEGTSIGNTMLRRYRDSTKWLKNIKAPEYSERLAHLRMLFEKYGEEYQIDWLILAALAFQESKFDQSARSRSGAVGIMQIKPSTARDPNVGIADVSDLESNIHAATKYVRFIADEYFGDNDTDDFNRILMAVASYNAGPNGIAKVRKKSDQPDIWFDALENDVARSVGMEPVNYVSNVYRYYLTLKGIVSKADASKGAIGSTPGN
jgi:membrane-bound lytic murein transglycosylase MltF